MTPLYLNMKAGAPARLAALRAAMVKHNANPNYRHADSWRDMRYGNLTSPRGLTQGTNGGKAIWYTHDGPAFAREHDAGDVIRMRHEGYYTDAHGDNIAVGIVAYIGKSRWLAGYRWTDNDERVYFAELHDSAEDAARMADEHARVFAEAEREYCERGEAARALQDRIDETRERVRELCALRNNPGFPHAREELRETLDTLRDALNERAADHNDFV